ncbi:MAG: GntR family transcriptional regulator [Ideonella sp.]
MDAPDQSVESRKRQAIEELEEDIVLGYLYPRERLVEDDLLARFRLKRHVVRQVLLELERMGLVERKKNIGAIVKAYSLTEVVDLYALREILETAGARLIAIPADPAKLDELEAIQRQHDDAAANADPRAAIRTNIAFHRAFFALSENQALTEMIELAAQRAHAIRSLTITVPEYLENARLHHWEMIEALRVADRERLVDLCSRHLHPARDAYINQLRQRAGRRSTI